LDIEIHLMAGTDENERNIMLQAISNLGMTVLEKMCTQ
jgi:hypothetical protein